MMPQLETRNLPDTSAQSRSPVRFCLLTFTLSVPFFLLGVATSLQLLAGIPVSAFAFVCPGLAAAILVYEERRVQVCETSLREPSTTAEFVRRSGTCRLRS